MSATLWIDVILVLIVVGYAISGWTRGFIANVSEIIGLVVGAVIGIMSAPIVFESMLPSGPGWALGYVVVMALLGQFFFRFLTSGIRFTSTTGNALNSLGGLVVSTVGVLVATWALGFAASRTNVPMLGPIARDSAVLATVDRFMPERAAESLYAFSARITDDIFPVYLEPFAEELIAEVDAPEDRILAADGIRAAASSVVRVQGYSVCTRQGASGSGFAIGPDRIMTNAHVVSGVREPVVHWRGRPLGAEVVHFDPQVDVAVLRVSNLVAHPLEFVSGGSSGDDAAVLGHPGGGDFRAVSARIRGVVRLKGSDIYDRGSVVRESLSLRTTVKQGNSGGPLVSLDGKVLGVIFAASVTDASTGYALTTQQVADAARAGLANSEPVSTTGC